ncbi:uncharacterized protein [Aegilops tauschii subsp. strangulata]|uniref:uncharacterized protein n=1 Tax=Aegilops tauschii subsp. strangulata TaxID=200361 RepID=UPI001E1CA9B1|nr:probable aminotransferase TAT2 isoform X1 [Aegilops tauschii subsp. strangulata]
MLGAAELLRGAGLNKGAAAGCSLVRMCVGRAAARGHGEHGGRSSCLRGMASTMHGTEQRERVARSYCSPGVSGKHNHYSPAVGVADARSRSKFQNELAAGDVILTADCNHAIEIMMAVLASPGANVLLPRPGYPTYEARAALCGLEFRHFNLMPEKGTTWARPRPLPFPPCLARSPPRSWSRHARLGGSRCGDGGGTCLGVNDWIYFHPHAKYFVDSPQEAKKKPPEKLNGWRCS